MYYGIMASTCIQSACNVRWKKIFFLPCKCDEIDTGKATAENRARCGVPCDNLRKTKFIFKNHGSTPLKNDFAIVNGSKTVRIFLRKCSFFHFFQTGFLFF